MNIQHTTDYDQFKKIPGNRELNVKHINKLVQSIAQKNMLETNPIVVNANMEIVDGQHRFEAAKANGWDIYYVIDPEAGLEDVQRLNTMKSSWSAVDFLRSYAELGNENYKKLQQLLVEYPILLSNAIHIFGSDNFSSMRQFKAGNFELKFEQEGSELCEGLMILKDFLPQRIWNGRAFVRACKQIFQVISPQELAVKLSQNPEAISYRVTVREYLRDVELLINKGNRGEYRRLV